MRLRYLLLLLTCFATDSYAQDGWFQIHSGHVSWYDAPSENTIFVISNNTLRRSLDGGNTWQVMSQWPKLQVVEEDQFHRIIAITTPVRFGSATHGLRTRLTQIKVQPRTDYSSYSLEEVTTDGGVTWTQTLSREASDVPTGAVFFEPSTWMTFRKEGDFEVIVPTPQPCFAVSTDGGMLWEVTTEGVAQYHRRFITPRPDLLFTASSQSSSVSTDSGATWKELPYGIEMALTPTMLYNKLADTTFISTDDGNTWTREVDSLHVRWTNGKGLVYASVESDQSETFFRSLDTGKTYEKLLHFQFKDSITLFDTNSMYALHNGVLLKSISGGRTLSVKNANDPSHSLKYHIDRNTVSVSEEVQWFDLLGRSYTLDATNNGQGWMSYRIDNLPRGMYLLQSRTSSITIMLNQ